MKKLFHTLIPAAMMLLTGCSTEIEEQIPSGNGEGMVHTVTMRLDGEIQHFDDNTRSVSSDWENNTKLYIQYQTSSGKVSGVATYNKSSDEWTVSYYGSITSNVKTACEVYYFENTKETTLSTVTLNEISAVYFDSQATYIYKEGIVYLKTKLKPKTGRLRFHGTPGSKFSFSGLKWFAEYNITDNKLYMTSEICTLPVNNDGFTPYVYASFSGEEDCRLTVYDSNGKYIYQRSFDNSSALIPTKSGYIDVPTLQSRNGWTMEEKALCPDNNHPHKIDMGNGLKWSCSNMGMYPSPKRSGYCYAWGETSSKSKFNDENYKYYKYVENDDYDDWIYTKYYNDDPDYGIIDNKTQLEPSDDAAHVSWGETWRMPTRNEFSALVSNCIWVWATLDGQNGYRAIAPNGNTIFLPLSGIYDTEWIDEYGDDVRQDVNEVGGYWTSTLDTDGCDYAFCIMMGWWIDKEISIVEETFSRCSGLSIRPVCE